LLISPCAALGMMRAGRRTWRRQRSAGSLSADANCQSHI